MSLVDKVKLLAGTGLISSAILLSGCGNVASEYRTIEVFPNPVNVRVPNNPNIRNARIIGLKMDNNGNKYEIWQYEDNNGKTHEEYLPSGK
jgi:hypothetical protein